MSSIMAERLNIYISLRELTWGNYASYENKQDKNIQNELRSSHTTSYNGIPTNEAKIITLDCKTRPMLRQNSKKHQLEKCAVVFSYLENEWQ